MFLCSVASQVWLSRIFMIEKEHIVEDSNGAKWIRKGRQKTKIMCNIPLMEVPLKILGKYSTNEYCKSRGVLFLFFVIKR